MRMTLEQKNRSHALRGFIILLPRPIRLTRDFLFHKKKKALAGKTPGAVCSVTCSWSIVTWNKSFRFHRVFQTFSSHPLLGPLRHPLRWISMSFLPFSDEEAEVSQTWSGSKSWGLHSIILSSGPWLFPRKPLLPRSSSELSPPCNTSPYTSVQAESESSSGTKERVNWFQP